MNSPTHQGVKRLIDANLNRLREGIRVVEEIARFILNTKTLATQLKKLRHDSIQIPLEEVIQARDTLKDTLKDTLPIELQRVDIESVVLANFKRAEESARVLEEILKLFNHESSEHFKKIRYELYAIEKEFFNQLQIFKQHSSHS